MRRPLVGIAAAALGVLAGCQATSQFLTELLKERPPIPLEAATVTSDLRIDSTGVLQGSLVGEGTPWQVHLLSSDTTIIAQLARAGGYDPRRSSVWDWLAKRRTVEIDPSYVRLRGTPQQIVIGSPDGHTGVRLQSILLHGSACGSRSAQAELVVEDARLGGPSLRGPVVASFRPGNPTAERYYRNLPPAMSDSLQRRLVAQTGAAADSVYLRYLNRNERPLSASVPSRLDINLLADFDAADVLPFRLDDGRVRYVVALREQRATANGIPVVAATMMVWDSAAVWRQFVFRPTLLEWRRGQLMAHSGWVPLFWRRVEAISGFAFDHDYLWLEQVDPVADRVLWVVMEPRSNNVVAAAEVASPCLD
jgi:hypothetical protein